MSSKATPNYRSKLSTRAKHPGPDLCRNILIIAYLSGPEHTIWFPYPTRLHPKNRRLTWNNIFRLFPNAFAAQLS